MKSLTVIYDDRCAFCVRCARWLERQQALIPLRCLAASDAEARRRFGPLGRAGDELAVISDDGGLYTGAAAWLMCLYALRDYRSWSLRLSSPLLAPLARRAFQILSDRRRIISRLLGAAGDEDLVRMLRAETEEPCER